MAKNRYVEDFEFDGTPVQVRAWRVRGEFWVDYRVWVGMSGQPGGKPVATIWRDPHQPRTHEWVVTLFDKPSREYYPTLGSALTAIGKRAAKEEV
jgi:hypothetical protein